MKMEKFEKHTENTIISIKSKKCVYSCDRASCLWKGLLIYLSFYIYRRRTSWMTWEQERRTRGQIGVSLMCSLYWLRARVKLMNRSWSRWVSVDLVEWSFYGKVGYKTISHVLFCFTTTVDWSTILYWNNFDWHVLIMFPVKLFVLTLTMANSKCKLLTVFDIFCIVKHVAVCTVEWP